MSTTAKEHNFTASAWEAIPAAERLELLTAIMEVREWRYGPAPPPWLPPIRQAALALHAHVTQTCHKGRKADF
jgi:hypothetical protein